MKVARTVRRVACLAGYPAGWGLAGSLIWARVGRPVLESRRAHCSSAIRWKADDLDLVAADLGLAAAKLIVGLIPNIEAGLATR